MEQELIGIAALYIVVELVKWFSPKSSLTSEESHQLKELYDMHMQKDDSGRPLWYFPVEMSKQSERILDCLQKISLSQNDTANIQKSTIKILERMEGKLDALG